MKNVVACILISSFMVICSGCLNPYSQYYTDHTGGQNVLLNAENVVPYVEPQLREGFESDKDAKEMWENGYGLIGISSFNGPEINQKQAIAQAKNVHAEIVIVYSQYTSTETGNVPITTPTTQTSYTSGNIYGTGGMANYSGTTTTYGTQTTYMPYSVQKYDYYASYWIKMQPPSLGICFEDLTDELRRKIGSNKGVCITIVMKNSPAFRADLLNGDIVRKIDEIEVIDSTHLKEMIATRKGQLIKLEIFRDGQTITKEIQTN